MFYSISWWDLIPFPFLVMALRAIHFRRVVGESFSKEGAGYLALYSLSYMIIDAIRNRMGWAVFDAGMFALWAHTWWNAGGGDGMKNFLQSLVMKPAHASK